MVKKFFLLAALSLVTFFSACSNIIPKKQLRIGIDPTFLSSPVGTKQDLIYAFTIELFEEIFKNSRYIPTYKQLSFDNTLDSLADNLTDAIISSLSEDIITDSTYDFSSMFLSLGDVLVTRADEPLANFKDLNGKIIAIQQWPNLISLFKNYPEVNLTYYTFIPEVLESISNYTVDGAIIPYLSLTCHLSMEYKHLLKVNPNKLTDIGLRLLTLSGKNDAVIKTFNKQLFLLIQNGTFEMLLEKWNLVL